MITLQIWDFNSGRMRDQDESGKLDVSYPENDVGFIINSYSSLIQDTGLASSKVLGEMYDMNSSNTQEDIGIFNVCPPFPYCNCASQWCHVIFKHYPSFDL